MYVCYVQRCLEPIQGAPVCYCFEIIIYDDDCNGGWNEAAVIYYLAVLLSINEVLYFCHVWMRIRTAVKVLRQQLYAGKQRSNSCRVPDRTSPGRKITRGCFSIWPFSPKKATYKGIEYEI